jgi:hypothetical protein
MSRRPVEIRPWRRADDLPPLTDVSKAADELCTDFGLNLPVDDSPDELVNAEHVLVAGTPPVGFAAVDTVATRIGTGQRESGRAALGALLKIAATGCPSPGLGPDDLVHTRHQVLPGFLVTTLVGQQPVLVDHRPELRPSGRE